MTVEGGPRVATDGLVLYLDSDNVKSYPGEPTTNLVPYPFKSNSSVGAYVDYHNGGWGSTTRTKIESMIGPFGNTVNVLSQELLSTTNYNHMEGAQYNINGGNSFALTAGITYTISAYVKSSVAHSSSNMLYLTGASNIGSAACTATTDWTRISVQSTPSVTGTYKIRHYFYGVPGVGTKVYYTGLQVEQKSHPTPFVNGTRSSTNGWRDLSGNGNHADLTNMTYDSNAALDFDGSTSYVDLGSALILGNNPWSLDFWMYPTSTGTPFFMGNAVSGQALVTYWDDADSDRIRIGVWGSDKLTATISCTINTWSKVSFTWDGITLRAYINGQPAGTATGFSFNITSNSTRLGKTSSGTQPFGGKINHLSVYSRVLSASEIRRIYNNTKSKYGY